MDEISTFRNDPIFMGNILAFVGPTGSGKTTTIGKLATRFVMKLGKDDIGLVSLDNFRIAAHEQLIAFGRILGIEVGVVDQENSLDEVLARFHNKKLILIDTAGYNIDDPRFLQQYEALAQSQHDIRTLLALDSTGHRAFMDQTYQWYEKYQLSGCIITKTDECTSLGEAISVAIEHLLSVAYVTFGQNIPEDIERASGQALVKKLLEVRQRQEARIDAVDIDSGSDAVNQTDDFYETTN